MISEELGSLAYSFDFQFADKPGLWLSSDVTVNQALDVLKTGLLKNHAVSKVKMFAINDGAKSVSFVYDVTAAKQGNFPWTLQNN